MSAASGFDMKVQRDAKSGAVIVQLVGDIALGQVDALDRQLLPVVASHPGVVIVDLSSVGFIASLGLGKLLELHRGISRNGGELRIAGVQQAVREVLVRCRLDAVLPMYENLAAAKMG
ncbi:MAG TPA: STAS domain-containing protein [Phycisphaerales bacterium]|nr:STAS domain-containing protein [Phycisphaerales bacterium]